jgi:hypothetical protein
MLFVPKNFKRVVVDAYVYHRYCRSRCVESWASTHKLVLEGKLLYHIISWGFSKDKLSVLKTSTIQTLTWVFTFLLLWDEHRVIIMKIFLRVFLSLTLQVCRKKIKGMTNARYAQPIIMQHWITFIQTWFFAKFKHGGIYFYNTSLAMLLHCLGYLYL